MAELVHHVLFYKDDKDGVLQVKPYTNKSIMINHAYELRQKGYWVANETIGKGDVIDTGCLFWSYSKMEEVNNG